MFCGSCDYFSHRVVVSTIRVCAGLVHAMAAAAAVRDGKVVVHFRHVGSAPILKQQKYTVPSDAKFSTVTALLRKRRMENPKDSYVWLDLENIFAKRC